MSKLVLLVALLSQRIIRFYALRESMAELLLLRGRNALSPFRVAKLLSSLAGTPITGVAAQYWHFIETQRDLTVPERERLERILSYGPNATANVDDGELLLVIPRPGTLSPWASKATEIARNCGLAPVARIERGVAYRVATRDKAALDEATRSALVTHSFDRMTEAVFPTFDDAARLFTHFAPRPLAMIDLLRHGRPALEGAE